MNKKEKEKFCLALYTLRCLYPMLSEENKKALDIALDLIDEKLNTDKDKIITCVNSHGKSITIDTSKKAIC